jgi:hypothetical protein
MSPNAQTYAASVSILEIRRRCGSGPLPVGDAQRLDAESPLPRIEGHTPAEVSLMESNMTCGTLMVYLGLGRANAELLSVAADLAERFKAGVIGVTATQPAQVGIGDGFLFWSQSDLGRQAFHSELEEAEAEFRNAFQTRVGALEWRSAVMCASIHEYLVREMRSADLLVIDICANVFTCDEATNALDFVRKIGRPVIVVSTLAAIGNIGGQHHSLRRARLGLPPHKKGLRRLSHVGQTSGGPSVTRKGD